MPQPQNIIGIIYDFDNTLSPHSMQDETILPYLGVESKGFWENVERLVRDRGYESELAWMRLLLEHEGFRSLSNEDLRNMGLTLTYFPGVPEVFQDLERILKAPPFPQYGISIEHYVVTSGLREILEGSNIKPHLKAIFGSEFDELKGEGMTFPKRAVGHTAKTQYLFRINKGYLDLGKDVNDRIANEERRIPFANMIYIGDGPTDVPCFVVMSEYGGRTLAVYNPDNPDSFEVAMQLHRAKRVEQFAEADYRRGSQLRRVLEHMVVEIASKICHEEDRERGANIIPAPRHV